MALKNFNIGNSLKLNNDIYIRHITFNDEKQGKAIGRCAVINLQEVQIRILVSKDLINRSFLSTKKINQSELPNLGINIPELIKSKDISFDVSDFVDLERCLFACNTLHTNYVRGNGFVITKGKLIFKPVGAIALDGKEYCPLNGEYSCLVLAPGSPRIRNLVVTNNFLKEKEKIEFAISGPQIIFKGQNVVKNIPNRKKEAGQTVGNEINYSPYEIRTSFTAFGVSSREELISVSMFAGWIYQEGDIVYYKAEDKTGITLNEMADLLIELGAENGIAGGGSGDTQQYIKNEGIWIAEPRAQENRCQVNGIRGLGAILCILSKN